MAGMRFLVLSCSHNLKSRSRLLARLTFDHLRALDENCEFVDISTLELPMCDAAGCYDAPDAKRLAGQIAAARGIIIAAPIYNYDVNAAAKNVLELTGKAWMSKVVGFVCAAGGHGSYMSIMPFANSLMLDFRCHIVPRFLYAPQTTADDEIFGDSALNQRADELARELVRITNALHP